MKLKRRKGTVIVVVDRQDINGEPIAVIFSPVEMDSTDERVQCLVKLVCMENETSEDDVTHFTQPQMSFTVDNRCPVVKYEFNPRPTRRSGTSQRGSSRRATANDEVTGSVIARLQSIQGQVNHANTSKTSNRPKTKSKHRVIIKDVVRPTGKSKR